MYALEKASTRKDYIVVGEVVEVEGIEVDARM